MATQFVPFPSDFPHKGQFRTWDRHWNPTGYADAPQYMGQVPINFPTNSTLLDIQVGGYLREDGNT